MHPLPAGSPYGVYTIVAWLGRGMSGPVYLVTDADGQRLALKALTHPDRSVGAYVGREITLLRRASEDAACSPHLPQYVTSQTTEGHDMYLVTRYIPGHDLRALLGRPCAPGFVARMATEVAHALDYLHLRHPNRPVIHRDVKPENIRVADDGASVLLDLAGAQSPDFARVGAPGFGTPPYTAPEHYSGQVTPASDQFALALIVYEALTGRAAAPRGTALAQRTLQQWATARRPLWAPQPQRTPQTLAVLQRAVAPQPSARYATCGAFAQALTDALQADGQALDRSAPPAPRRRCVPEPGMRPVVALVATLLVAQLGLVGGVTARQESPAVAASSVTARQETAAGGGSAASVRPAAPGSATLQAAPGGCALRAGPSFTESWIPYQGGNVPEGRALTVLEQRDQWAHVALPDGAQGWCPQTQLTQEDADAHHP